MSFQVIYPPQLDKLEELDSSTIIIGYNPNTGKMVRINAGLLVANTAQYPDWNPTIEWNTGDIVVWQFKFWESLEDGNEGNIPSENAHWTEVSPTFNSNGAWVDCGNVDLSLHQFPETGGTGLNKAVMRNNTFDVTVVGSPGGGDPIPVGATIRALIDNPGQTLANWRIYY